MKRAAATLLALFLAGGAAVGKTRVPWTTFIEEQVRIPSFGAVTVYRPEPVQQTRGVVLFVSGDGGWNLGVVTMARRAAPRAIVVGLSMPEWRTLAEKTPGGCWYPAGELEATAQAVEKIYKLPRYLPPILVGYSSGATLVYGALAQAPAGTFAGAISLGFCPDLTVARPLCSREEWKPAYDAGKKRNLLPPCPNLGPRDDGKALWTALQGQIDKVCDPPSVKRFVSQVPGGRLVPLPKVGHGFSRVNRWEESFDRAIDALLPARSAWAPLAGEADRTPRDVSQSGIEDRVEALRLPLIVDWADGAQEVVIFVSGDGGWAELDRELAYDLTASGVAVVGWDSLDYFWERKTRSQFLADLLRLVEAMPKGVRVFVGGYSFGAEIVAVALGRSLSQDTSALSEIAGLLLVAPGPYATYEVSPLDWLRSTEAPTKHPVRRALEADAGVPVLCLEPSDESESGCPQHAIPGVTRDVVKGGHHFGGHYERLSQRILQFLSPSPAAGSGDTDLSRSP